MADATTTFTPRADRDLFIVDLTIQPADIDLNGHVNNVVYVGWMQAAGIAHWEARTLAEERTRWSWVVARHEIDYKQPLRFGDRVRARTWVGDPVGARFDRFVLIERGDGVLCAQGRTRWVLVDATTMRPARIPPAMVAPFARG